MRVRKTSLLKWVAMLELVIGAYNLMTGLMSAYVLITDLDGVMASFTECRPGKDPASALQLDYIIFEQTNQC